jgi:hypothetical protein
MIDALRPGGWLLLEEADPGLQGLVCLDEYGDEQRLANKLKLAFRSLMAERGVDLAFGRTLPRRLRVVGLSHVGSDAYFPIGGPACNELERATTVQIRDRLVESGLVSKAEIDQHLSNIASGDLDLATSPMGSGCCHRLSTGDSRSGTAWHVTVREALASLQNRSVGLSGPTGRERGGSPVAGELPLRARGTSSMDFVSRLDRTSWPDRSQSIGLSTTRRMIFKQ